MHSEIWQRIANFVKISKGIDNLAKTQLYSYQRSKPSGVQNMYTLEEVADILRVSTATVRKLIESGELKAKKVRGQWRIRKEDLDAYMSS